MKYGVFASLNEKMPISTHLMREKEESGVRLGISKLQMMESAGSAIANFIAQQFGNKDSPVGVLLLAGTGNNGGDVFVAARHLSYWRNKFKPTVALIGSEDIRAEEASQNWRVLKSISGIEICIIDSIQKVNLVTDLIHGSEVLVIGIFGTGFKGKPRELHREVIQIINSSAKATKISVDVPSGMDADSGLFETAVISDYTITMDSPKVGMIANEPAKKICGEILVANIGLSL